VVLVAKSKLADLDLEPKVGELLSIPQSDGPPVDATVADVTDSEVTVDFNHPLAGEDLSFDIELVDIVYGAH